MWYTGYSKIKDNLEDAQKIIAQVKKLGLDNVALVKYEGKVYKIKQLWISGVKDIDIRVELDDPSYEDVMIDLCDVEYGPAIEVLFGEKV